MNKSFIAILVVVLIAAACADETPKPSLDDNTAKNPGGGQGGSGSLHLSKVGGFRAENSASCVSPTPSG